MINNDSCYKRICVSYWSFDLMIQAVRIKKKINKSKKKILTIHMVSMRWLCRTGICWDMTCQRISDIGSAKVEHGTRKFKTMEKGELGTHNQKMDYGGCTLLWCASVCLGCRVGMTLWNCVTLKCGRKDYQLIKSMCLKTRLQWTE